MPPVIGCWRTADYTRRAGWYPGPISASYLCDTANNDCHVLVVERSQKKLYELYNSTKSGSAFTALGAFVWDLTKAYPADLRGDQCTSADAAGLPIAAADHHHTNR